MNTAYTNKDPEAQNRQNTVETIAERANRLRGSKSNDNVSPTIPEVSTKAPEVSTEWPTVNPRQVPQDRRKSTEQKANSLFPEYSTRRGDQPDITERSLKTDKIESLFLKAPVYNVDISNKSGGPEDGLISLEAAFSGERVAQVAAPAAISARQAVRRANGEMSDKNTFEKVKKAAVVTVIGAAALYLANKFGSDMIDPFFVQDPAPLPSTPSARLDSVIVDDILNNDIQAIDN